MQRHDAASRTWQSLPAARVHAAYGNGSRLWFVVDLVVLSADHRPQGPSPDGPR